MYKGPVAVQLANTTATAADQRAGVLAARRGPLAARPSALSHKAGRGTLERRICSGHDLAGSGDHAPSQARSDRYRCPTAGGKLEFPEKWRELCDIRALS
jgi:hypothetical protein